MAENFKQQNTPEAQERTLRYERLRANYDVRNNGAIWYRRHIGQKIDFPLIFKYVAQHANIAEMKFRDQIFHIVKQQLALQTQIAAIEKSGTIDQRSLELFETLTKGMHRLQGKFEKSPEIARRAAQTVFIEIMHDARRNPPVEEPVHEPEAASAAAEGSETAQPEEQNEASGSHDSGEETVTSDNGSGGEEPPSGTEHVQEEELPFEFSEDKLKTAQGRRETFREMVRMYNDVRNKRDELGFGEVRDAEGNLIEKAQRNVKNEDFDGFIAFRRRYSMLKDEMAAFAEKGVIRDESGRITGRNETIELSPEEAADFKKGFDFLNTYYGRTEQFKAEGTEPRSEAPNASAPSPEEGETVTGAPQSEESAAREKTASEDQTAPGGAGVPPQGNSTGAAEAPETPEAKKYQERTVLRNTWKEKKAAYESAYQAYLNDAKRKKDAENVFQKAMFWRKDEIPQSVTSLQLEYQEARRSYAASLNEALGARLGGVAQSEGDRAPEERVEALRAGLANRFVINAAHDKLALERMYVPEGRALRVFEDLQKTLRKHRTVIRTAGYVTVAGVALASGGIAGAVIALSGKYARAKMSAILGAAGATAGAHVANAISESIIGVREERRAAAQENAQYSFSLASLDALERNYEKRYREYERSVRNKKYAIAMGAIAGASLGIAAGQSIAELDLTNHPNFEAPHDHEPVVPREDLEHQLSQEPQSPVLHEPASPVLTGPAPDEADESSETVMATPAPHEVIPAEPAAPVPVPPEAISQTPEVSAAPAVPETPAIDRGIDYTFVPNNSVNTVSEALFETWKANPDILDTGLSHKAFLAHMYSAMSEIEKDPAHYQQLLDQMHISSGDLDQVQIGETIDLRPFFEYLNNKA